MQVWSGGVTGVTHVPDNIPSLDLLARLDQLGALTKGQRQTGSQGIFQARDNLESEYARIGLYQLFTDIVNGDSAVTESEFEEQTALRLTDEEGGLLAELPTAQKFMNRLLSMTIENQNKIFDEWSERIDNVIDGEGTTIRQYMMAELS